MILQTVRYLDEIGELDLLGDQEESANSILEDSIYNYAVGLYEAGDFSQAILYFDRLSSELHRGLDIEGWNLKVIIYSSVEKDTIIKIYYYNFRDWEISQNELVYSTQYSTGSEHYEVYLKGLRFYWTGLTGSGQSLNYSYYYFVRTDKLPEQKKDPFIGMTAEELKKSSWGEPNDINKTTYSWGVREQWCYSGYRYVYLEDGIVTSISE